MPAPQNGVLGSDAIVRVHDGVDPGEFIEVEYQGDASYDTGVKQNLKRYKNGSLPFQSKDGATLSMTVGKTRPLAAGQTRLWAVAASGELVQIEYDDPNTGGHKRAGYAQVSMGPEKTGVNENVEAEFSIAFVDDPTETVNA